MDQKMPENWIAQLMAKVAEYWSEYRPAIFVILIGIIGGVLKYLIDVKDGREEWSFWAFFLAAVSSGFLSLMLFWIFLGVLEWSMEASVAASGIIAYVGAKNVEAVLTQVILRKFR